MSEKTTIIKRSKIYSSIKIFFIVFIFLALTFIGVLRYGITIDHIELPEFQVEQLYIKWNKKLVISVKKALFFPNKSSRSQPLEIKRTLSLATKLYTFFETVDIKYLRFKDIELSLLFSDKQNGYINLTSEFSTLKSKLFLDHNNISLEITELSYTPLKLNTTGYIVFDKSNHSLESDMDFNIANEAFFHLRSDLIEKKLYYTLHFNQHIKDTKKIIKLFSLPKPVLYWVIDAIKANSLEIKQFYGKIDLDNPNNSLKNLYVKAIAHNLSYTYHPKIAPVKTDYTLLEFKNSVLYIRPHNPIEYGYNLEKSYLTIDFSKPKNETLSLYLRFNKGKLDKNILHILSTYKIKVPLVQNSGYTKTDLTLKVRLRHPITVNAVGTFYVKKGNFHYLGMDIDVSNVLVKLHNSDIKVKGMNASLKNAIYSKVDLNLELAKKKGKIDFYIKKLSLNNPALSLKKPLHISYYINPNTLDTITVPYSQWKINDIDTNMEAIKIPFNFKKLSMHLPLTHISMNKTNKLSIQGDIFLKNLLAKITLNVQKFQYKDLSLKDPNVTLFLNITKENLQLSSNKLITLQIDKTPFYLHKFQANYKNNKFSIKKMTIKIPKIITALFSLNYDTNKHRGGVDLLYSKIIANGWENIFQNTQNIHFHISYKKKFKIFNKELALFSSIDNNGNIFAQANDFSKLVQYSPLFKRLQITNGEVKLHKNHFSGYIQSKYALLLENNKLLNRYDITGNFDEKRTKVYINKRINITINQKLYLIGKKVYLNLKDTEKLISDLTKDSKKRKRTLSSSFILKDGYLYISDKRKILYDTLKINTKNNIINATLTHHKANASFTYIDEKFKLSGSNFDDTFMDNLFMQSKFKGGALSFNMVGSFDKYDGVVSIDNTTILDYKILNNILAFIDTVPSLVTFSLPSYSKEGLRVSNAYASFKYYDHIFHFDNISMNSDQIDIIGKGTASYTYNTIDLLLQLKTNLANKASKIPVVGYIIFDGKSISTSLKVKGKLTDPKVSLTLAKDIAVAPLNIIKRTILYPFHLFGLDKDQNTTK